MISIITDIENIEIAKTCLHDPDSHARVLVELLDV